MADQADDLSIPTNPAPPMARVTVPPPRIADPSRPGAEPANTPASSRVADLPRPGAEPAHAQISPRQPTEPQPGTQQVLMFSLDQQGLPPQSMAETDQQSRTEIVPVCVVNMGR
jgi:hypothetical protein